MRGIFDCPGCGSGIPIPAATARTVRCATCGATISVRFVDDPSEVTANVRSHAAVEQPAVVAVRPTAPASRPLEQITAARPAEPSPPKPEERPKKRVRDRGQRPKRGSGKTLIAVIAGGVLLALLVGGIVVALSFRGGHKAADAAAGAPASAVGAPAQPNAAKAPPGPRGSGVLDAARASWSVPSGAPDPAAELPDYIEVDNLSSFRILNRYADVLGSDGHGALRGRISKEGHLVDTLRLEAGSAPVWWTAEAGRDGTLAMAVPERSSIQFWDPGRAKPRTVAGPPLDGLTWWRWAGKDRLFALYPTQLMGNNAGRLICWDAARGQEVFKVGHEFDVPIDIAPSGQWIAVAVRPANWKRVRDPKTEIVIYSTTTSEVICRVGTRGHWTRLSVSPDGKELIGLRSVAHLSDIGGIDLYHWDMTTGAELGMIHFDYAINSDNFVRWWGPGRALLVSSKTELSSGTLVDLNSHTIISSVEFPSRGRDEGSPGRALLWSPDGRPWWSAMPRADPRGKPPARPRLHVFNVACPAPDLSVAALRPGATVDLEVKCPEDRRERVTGAVAAVLQRERYQIGTSGWKLRVTAAQEPSGATMQFPASGLKVPTPAAAGSVELIAPDGSSLRRVDYRVPFGGNAYLTKYTTKGGPNNLTLIYEFDFKGKDPIRVMTEEVWDGLIAEFGRGTWPRLAWQKDGKFTTAWPPVKMRLPEFLQ